MTDKVRLFFLDQHGCAKNQVDGELLIAKLATLGWQRTDECEKASLIIINSCGFIESAKKESLTSIFEARSAYPNAKILLAGCLSQRYADEFSQNLEEVDGIFGNGDLSKIDIILDKMFSENSSCEKNKPVLTPNQEGVCNGERIEFLNFPSSAYVKVTEGCNNRCAFCAIPIIRGSLRSRKIKDIVEEIESLISRGIFEINLIGQDLACYGVADDENEEYGNTSKLRILSGVSGSIPKNTASPLSVLLKAISKIQGKFWIRLLYIHPDNFPLDILPVIANDKRLLPYFDIPFQSGDDSIIKAMNRHGSSTQYIELVNNIRNAFDDSIIRTTFLCGFPGETEENAHNTENFLRQINSDWSGCFTYSKEDDTPAYSMKNQVPLSKSKKRSEQLTKIQQEITQQRLQHHIGKTYQILIEEIIDDSEKKEGLAIGRAWFQAPEVDGSVVVSYELDDKNAVESIKSGNVINATVYGISGVDLSASFLNE